MPKMSGIELAPRMAALHPKLQVLYMSGYAEYARPAENGSHRNAFRLQKPFSMAALARSVREALNAKHSIRVRAE